ncbi:MAG TPA: PAS domain S-box protein [Methanospirillum sp.]|nr:PAS domain S-box protein [Methanospirillum sp.]
MNLRIKTLLILALTLFASVTILLTLSYTFMIGNYTTFEEENMNVSIIRGVNALSYDLTLLEFKCADWSGWDETYGYVQGKDPQYIERNLNPDTLSNLGIDLIMFIDLNGSIISAYGYNRSEHYRYELSQSVISRIAIALRDGLSPDEVNRRSGYLSLPEYPLMIVSQPVLKSTYEGPPAGVLIFGKYLDPITVSSLSRITGLNLTVLSDRTKVPAIPYHSPPEDKLKQESVTTPDSDTILGYAPVIDLNGDEAFILMVTDSREFFQQGQATIVSYVLLLVGIGCIFTITALFSIDRLVLARLNLLIERVKNRDSSERYEDLQQGEDELAILARAITPVFDLLSRSEHDLRESNQRYKGVVEGQNEFICRSTLDGQYLFANQAYCQYLNQSLDSIIQSGIYLKIYPDDARYVADHIASLSKASPVVTVEYRVIRSSGELRWHQWTHVAIFDYHDNLIEFQSVGRDITDKVLDQENLKKANQELQDAYEELYSSDSLLKENMKKLEESEKKYRDLADSLPEFVFEVNTEGKITFLNRLGLMVTGYSESDLNEGLDAVMLLAPWDRERLMINMRSILAGARISGQEYAGYRKDCTEFPVVIYSIPVVIDDVVTGLRGFAIDITDRKLMEESLRKMADIVSNTRTGIMTGSGSTIDVTNPAFAVMHGYTPGEMGEIAAFSLFSAEMNHEFPRYLEKAENLGHLVFESDHIHKDGSRFPTLNDLTVIRDLDGMVKYWILNVQDITEHRLAWKILMESEALRESQRQLRAVISHLPDATFVVDKDGWVILWNEAMEDLTGIPADKIIGRGLPDYSIPFFGYEHPMLINLILKPALKDVHGFKNLTHHGDTLSIEEYFPQAAHGCVFLSSVANPLYDSKGKIIGAIESIRDITGRKLVEAALMKTNEKLNLLSSITRHDIRNRITVLFGLLPLVKKMSISPDMDEMLMLLEKAAYAIRDQIEFTGDYQDLGVYSPEWSDTGAIIEKTILEIIPEGIECVNGLNGVFVYADPLLQRVFYNLADNAIRHGGMITRIVVTYESEGDGMVILVTDNGRGIPAYLKEKVFERGYGKNTGLGLFLVREILSITGITIRETGVEGSGARFEMRVPDGSYRIERKRED